MFVSYDSGTLMRDAYVTISISFPAPFSKCLDSGKKVF